MPIDTRPSDLVFDQLLKLFKGRKKLSRGYGGWAIFLWNMQQQNHGGLENDVDHADNDSEDQTGRSFQKYLDTCDDDHENQNDHSPEKSPFSSNNDSEEQNIGGDVDDKLITCSTENESEYSGKCLDLNDPKVIILFAQPKPSKDPLCMECDSRQKSMLNCDIQ